MHSRSKKTQGLAPFARRHWLLLTVAGLAFLALLAGQPAFRDIELEQAMAGGQGHAVHIGGVPRGHDQAAAVGVGLDHLHQLGDLVDVAAVRGGPVAPLVTVHRAEVSVGICPFIPDSYSVFF